ncbi:hypothetical protein HYW21_06535 [Candidatus Woesearchaeota archaeon]|nr:hypothetical protein [Candidatus Woesearchaeota archaeon]
MSTEVTRGGSLNIPHAGRIVVPNGSAFNEYTSSGKSDTLSTEDVSSITADFDARRTHFERFYALATEGNLLQQLLELTSRTSYMGATLAEVRERASLRNDLAELIHGDDTKSYFIAEHLPWVSILTHVFISTPIPENREAVAEAQESLDPLAALAAQERSFYDSFRAGIRVPVLRDGASFGVQGLENALEVTVFSDDHPLRPQRLSADATTVDVGGRSYYNASLADREKYPFVLMPEGSKLSLRIKNRSPDKVYMVVPSVNGMPVRVQRLNLDYSGFTRSSLPVSKITAEKTYLKPGDEVDFARFHVDAMQIVSGREGSSLYREDISDLAFLFGRIFDRNVSSEARLLVDHFDDPHLQGKIMYESRIRAVMEFLGYIAGSGYYNSRIAKESDIRLGRPEIAKGKTSSDLANPHLGSIGISVVEVFPPPRKATHEHVFVGIDSSRLLYSGGLSRSVGGMGVTGAAHITGGPDRAAEKTDWYSQYQFDSNIHRFVGYVPLNVNALR